MLFVARLRQTLYFSSSLKWTKRFSSFSIPTFFGAARKVKSRQHLVTCVCLCFTRGTPGRRFRKVPSISLHGTAPACRFGCQSLRCWRWRYNHWNGNSVQWRCLWHYRHGSTGDKILILSIIATDFSSSGSISLPTLWFRCAKKAMPIFFPSHNTSIRMGFTTPQEHFTLQPPPWRAVTGLAMVLRRIPLVFSMKQLQWLCGMWGIVFKCFVNFWRRKRSLELRLFRCGVRYRYMAAVQLQQKKRSSWVASQIRWPVLCVATSFLLQ